ncbi:type I restriction endonuclease subunit R [Rhodovulum strictum]|uniref:Type I restriction enzyme endonuclease subunit n=1 Tax=Rhodovulum strictum TaxID=58314 RepID=A0A844BLT6_9RHOB|nr:type I restriction endonuclease subunit R [Rhodovulum strictum]MRH21913.1 HsdR family type I site-specific deoxyribonuclease [Rhodovulum strictum]
MTTLTEAEVEAVLLDHLERLSYACLNDTVSGPDGSAPERDAYSDTILPRRLRAAVARLNPHIPEDAREDAIRRVIAAERPSLIVENRRLHRALVEGVPVEYRAEDGTIRGDSVRLMDPDDRQNDWLAIAQFTVTETGNKRRPDVVVFLNGLPVGVIEVKKPGAEAASLTAAFNQLQTYKAQVPSLFRTNAVLVTTDGIQARVGSLTADQERFMPWRTTDGAEVAPKGAPEMSVLIEGVFERGRLLALMRDFTVFGETPGGIAKIIAGYHQFHAVRRAVDSTVTASRGGGDRKAGVIWHTQGSGKSLLMAFYAGQLVREPAMENPTIVVITDRNDLDDQLFGTFAMCRDLIRQTPVQADSREDLQQALARASGGVVFTTIQKFAPEKGEAYPMLTDRRNVVVIADEAHRSQYGFKARIEKTGEIAYGFAKHLRDALPNASFIGFTGTPIEKDDVNTPAVFGHYIDIYDISRAVEDGATVPIYYESRLARIELPEDKKPRVDAEIEALTEDEAASEQERLKRKWSTIEALVGAERRLRMVAEDLVAHFEDRVAAMDGKAMVVCMSRRICVELYNQVVALRPDWHSDDDNAGLVKIVMTGSASDPEAWQPHIGGKARRDLLAKRAKDPKDPLKLVIVRDMWLTGFDAPSMHTMYIDKPMRGHGLMQAIARVNRVFRDKPAGLIVDYIGIAQNLKSALGQYSAADQRQAGIDEAEAVAALLERLDVVRAMFHGFDYRLGITGTPQQRLVTLAEALNVILARQDEAAQRETDKEAKKAAHRRFQDAVLALSKAFALSSASDAAREVRDEVGFFQTVRAAMVKAADTSGRSDAERDLAIRQIVNDAVASTEIVDILSAAGLSSPDISILSDEFLAEVGQMEKKNLALEALRKLLNDEIKSRSRSNVIETRKFSERLEEAIARYHTNAISTVEVLQELIALAKDVREARNRGEEIGLTPEEVAFYDALAENESAVEVLGNDQLKVIAHELLKGLQANASVDWARRDSARARLRVLVKRILRKYGYPPDLEDAAVQGILAQAEAILSEAVR